MKILGVDASLTCTGYSVLDGNNLIKVGKIQEKDKRLYKIYTKLKEIIKAEDIKIIKIEDGYIGGKNKQGDLTSAKVRGLIELLAEEFDIKLIKVAPSSVKKNITGNGNATKEEVYLELVKLYNTNIIFNSIGEFSDKNNKKKTSDIYDSVAIALF